MTQENAMIFNFIEHKNILLQILKDIYTDTALGPILGFKGGTAAHLFYNLNRYSVDLDFDLLDINKSDYVYKKIGEILKKYGAIKQSRKKRYTIFFLLSYGERSRNIKVEINLRNFGSKYELKNYLGITMKVMVKEDMFANKLVAMFERLGKTNRDIFDVWFFLKNGWPINNNIITLRTNIPFKDFLRMCITSLEKMSDRNILSGIGELFDIKQKTWIKNNLRKDTIFLLKIRLSDEQ